MKVSVTIYFIQFSGVHLATSGDGSDHLRRLFPACHDCWHAQKPSFCWKHSRYDNSGVPEVQLEERTYYTFLGEASVDGLGKGQG